MIRLKASAGTDVGKIRSNNEDNYYVNGSYKENTEQLSDACEDNAQRDSYTYAVCDGMGGEAYGEVASFIAVKTLQKYDGSNFLRRVDDYIQDANQLICCEIEKNAGARIGTTIALLHIDNGVAYCYNIGDSRIYFYRDHALQQVTKDHTQAQSMVDMGLLKPENMNAHSAKHKLTQHLGIFSDELVIQPYESSPITLRPNDVFIICSDGVTDMLSDDEIAEIAARCQYPVEMTKEILNAALEKGGRDNTTAITVKIEETGTGKEKQRSIWSKIMKK